MSYQGILFPDRAEYVNQPNYTSYRVFLGFWQPLANQLREFYEPVVLRGTTRMLLIHAPQGGGKTMFATKLAHDFNSTKINSTITPSDGNLWHRISGDSENGAPTLNHDLIRNATTNTTLISITNDTTTPGIRIDENKEWLNNLSSRISSIHNHRWIIIIDNAERGHFIQSLLSLSDAEFMDRHNDPQTTQTAIQRFVGKARTSLRGCLFVVLTNNEQFSDSMESAIVLQDKSMLARTNLPLPGSSEKETAIRVNINRLNNISYWYCLDRAGPTEKIAVYEALNGAETFPGSFAAVDAAIRSSNRVGRQARSCVLSLVVLTKNQKQDQIDAIGQKLKSEIDYGWLSITNFKKNWANGILDTRRAALLESEWILRVIVIGEPFIKSLISGAPKEEEKCQSLMDRLKQPFTPGMHTTTLEKNKSELEEIVEKWTDNSSTNIDACFWSMGQRRSTIYEPILSRLLPSYNQTAPGFLTYRPDLTIGEFKPCSILSAKSNDIKDITAAIYRDAHTFEFTAIEHATTANIRTYLSQKLDNYADIVQEQ